MTELRLEDTLQAIHDERSDLPDAPTVSSQLLGVPLRDVPQERRWLPGWLTGTSRTLFGGARLAAAAVVVGLFGAVLLLGLLPAIDDDPAATPTPTPIESPEPTPSDLLEAAPVTGRADPGSDVGDGSRHSEGDVTYSEDAWYTQAWEADDARLTGEATIRYDSHDYVQLDFALAGGLVELETAAGRWRGDARSLSAADDATTTMLLHGEDAYEGLTAYVVVAQHADDPPTFDAAVFPGEMPEHVPDWDAAPSPAPMRAATAQDLEPAVVTGSALFTQVWAGGARFWDGSRIVGEGQFEEYVFVADDARLTGDFLSMFDYIYYEKLGVYVADGHTVLDTADGRWTGDFTFVGGEALENVATSTLRGEGPYEGLTATLVLDILAEPRTFTAAIIEGDPPAGPDPN